MFASLTTRGTIIVCYVLPLAYLVQKTTGLLFSPYLLGPRPLWTIVSLRTQHVMSCSMLGNPSNQPTGAGGIQTAGLHSTPRPTAVAVPTPTTNTPASKQTLMLVEWFPGTVGTRHPIGGRSGLRSVLSADPARCHPVDDDRPATAALCVCTGVTFPNQHKRLFGCRGTYCHNHCCCSSFHGWCLLLGIVRRCPVTGWREGGRERERGRDN